MTNKTFTVAGYSVLNGVRKLRVANDLATRIKVLQRNGHTDIDLRELPYAMSKEDAAQWLETGFVQESPVQMFAGAMVPYGLVQAAAERIVPQRINGRFAKKQVRQAAMEALIAA